MENIKIEISSTPLNLEDAMQFVSALEAGAVATFVGTVRNHSKGKPVKGFLLQVYEPMVKVQFLEIAKQAVEKFNLFSVFISHRKGELLVGDVPVIVAVSSVHRKEAFGALDYIMDRLKSDVPIWKKEHYVEDSLWLT